MVTGTIHVLRKGGSILSIAARKMIFRPMRKFFLTRRPWRAGHQIFQVRGWSMARNNNLLAVGIDTAGGRKSTLYIKDLASGQMLPEVISNTSANFAWSNDSKTLYYVLN